MGRLRYLRLWDFGKNRRSFCQPSIDVDTFTKRIFYKQICFDYVSLHKYFEHQEIPRLKNIFGANIHDFPWWFQHSCHFIVDFRFTEIIKTNKFPKSICICLNKAANKQFQKSQKEIEDNTISIYDYMSMSIFPTS